MKASGAVLAVILVSVSAVWATQSGNSVIDHAECLSKEDVIWHMNRSKSGIPRGCTDGVLRLNIDQVNSK